VVQLTGATKDWRTMNSMFCGEYAFVGELVFSQNGACATDASVNNFKEYCYLSVVSWSYHPWSFQSLAPKENNVPVLLLMDSQVV